MRKDTKWYGTMLEIHGSEEAITAAMAERQKKSRLNPNTKKGVHRGGFSYLSKEEVAKIGHDGAVKRWAKLKK